MDIRFTREALKVVTPKQIEALNFLCREVSGTLCIQVSVGGFDLPDGYLSLRRIYRDPMLDTIYGGISPEGDVST